MKISNFNWKPLLITVMALLVAIVGVTIQEQMQSKANAEAQRITGYAWIDDVNEDEPNVHSVYRGSLPEGVHRIRNGSQSEGILTYCDQKISIERTGLRTSEEYPGPMTMCTKCSNTRP